MYGQLDRAKLFTLTQALSDLKQVNHSVPAVFNQLSALWSELEAAEERLEVPETTLRQYKEIKEREKATRFLLMLNDSYSSFRSQILAMESAPSLNRIYQLAILEESRRLTASEHARIGEGVTLAAFPCGVVETESTAGGQGGLGNTAPQQTAATESTARAQRSIRTRGAAAASRENDGYPRSSRMDSWDRRTGSDGSYLSINLAESNGPYQATSVPAYKGSYGSRGATSLGKVNGQISKLKNKYCDYYKRRHHTVDTC